MWTSELGRDWGFLWLSFLLKILTEHLLCFKQCPRYRDVVGKTLTSRSFLSRRGLIPAPPLSLHSPFVTDLLIFKSWGEIKDSSTKQNLLQVSPRGRHCWRVMPLTPMTGSIQGHLPFDLPAHSLIQGYNPLLSSLCPIRQSLPWFSRCLRGFSTSPCLSHPPCIQQPEGSFRNTNLSFFQESYVNSLPSSEDSNSAEIQRAETRNTI